METLASQQRPCGKSSHAAFAGSSFLPFTAPGSSLATGFFYRYTWLAAVCGKVNPIDCLPFDCLPLEWCSRKPASTIMYGTGTGRDVALIRIPVRDRIGTLVPDAARPVHFS